MRKEEFSAIFLKANWFISNSEHVKSLCVTQQSEDIYHYGMEVGTPIQVQHIFAILTYTDFTELCTAFSSSFRRITEYESLESIKRRMHNFGILAKHLEKQLNILVKKDGNMMSVLNGIWIEIV